MSKYTLRAYQELDVKKSLARCGIINANPPGVGKTLETLDALSRLPKGSTLVICPKMASGVWAYEGEKWLDWDSFRYTGEYKAEIREAIREDYDKLPSRLFIINIQMLDEVLAWRDTWTNIVVDEAHLLGLLNSNSKAFKSMCRAKYERIFILTGTPVRKGPQDLWSLLHLIDPKRFRSYWAFVNRYCVVLNNGFGREIMNKPKHPEIFRQMLEPYMIRHKKEEILKDLPPKMRLIHNLSMNKEQEKAHAELIEEMMTELGDDLVLVQSTLSVILRTRQLMVCPKLIGGKTYGTAIDALCEYLVPEEFENNRSVAIATSFRQAIPYIAEALQKAIPDIQLFFIHGQIKETAQEVAMNYQLCTNRKKALIYTIQSGASWTATDASTGFMLGYDWSAINNEQAEDRIHRIGQTEIVYWKYLLYDNSVDEEVMNKLDERARGIKWTLEPRMMAKKIRDIQKRNLNIK